MRPVGNKETAPTRVSDLARGPDGAAYAISDQHPAESFLYGLRGDMEWVIINKDVLVTPEERGFTSTAGDNGLCKYCQLILSPSPPPATIHQKNLQALILSASTCNLCQAINSSLAEGSPTVGYLYNRGFLPFCDPNDTSHPISVSISAHSTHTQFFPVVGQRQVDPMAGRPLIASTASRLGDLTSRGLWQPESETRQSTPRYRIKILETWAKECLEHDCCPTVEEANDTILPPRILDFTGSPDNPERYQDIVIRLRDTAGERARYTALSYCWGADPTYHAKTTAVTLQSQNRNIPYGNLPLTFQDAVLITLRLGVRYLWIDSLCIIQDSRQDWVQQAAKMDSVYMDAFLTIAATSSASPKDGCLYYPKPPMCIFAQGETFMVRYETNNTLVSLAEPLNTRAWALQESCLSRRVVCLGREPWIWRCAGRFTTEDGITDRNDLSGSDLGFWAKSLRLSPSEGGQEYLRHWYSLISKFSTRSLTFQEDKLPAMAGLVAAFEKQTGDRSVAGLWEKDLHRGFLWAPIKENTPKVKIDGIPSWSWVAVDGGVDWTGRYMNPAKYCTEGAFELCSAEQQWSGLPTFSDLLKAELRLKGRMIEVLLDEKPVTDASTYSLLPVESDGSSAAGKEVLGFVRLDMLKPTAERISSGWCFDVSTSKSLKGPMLGTEYDHNILFLASAPGRSNDVYYRVGLGVLWHRSHVGENGFGGEAFRDAVTQSILLV